MHATLETILFLRAYGLAALCEKYHIFAKRHSQFSNLVQLKYSQIESPMAETIVQECRGLIVDEQNDWDVIAYPFKKFFNHGEPNAITIDWSSAKVQEKLDGSLVTLYRYNNNWQVATSGIPNAAGPVGASFPGSFKELFWHTWNASGYRLPEESAPLCYMFELMTPHNRIICRQSNYRLVLIGARRIDATFEEQPPGFVALQYQWESVRAFPLATPGDCVTAAAELNPLDAEGYVVSDARFNRIKIKSPRYVALAHLKEGLTPRRILEIVRANESDEFLTHFPEWQAEYTRVATAYNTLCDHIAIDYAALVPINDRKEFARAAQQSRCAAALFAMKDMKARTPREFFGTCTLPMLERALGIDLTPGNIA